VSAPSSMWLPQGDGQGDEGNVDQRQQGEDRQSGAQLVRCWFARMGHVSLSTVDVALLGEVGPTVRSRWPHVGEAVAARILAALPNLRNDLNLTQA
jgi:hypothetical protein